MVNHHYNNNGDDILYVASYFPTLSNLKYLRLTNLNHSRIWTEGVNLLNNCPSLNELTFENLLFVRNYGLNVNTSKGSGDDGSNEDTYWYSEWRSMEKVVEDIYKVTNHRIIS